MSATMRPVQDQLHIPSIPAGFLKTPGAYSASCRRPAGKKDECRRRRRGLRLQSRAALTSLRGKESKTMPISADDPSPARAIPMTAPVPRKRI
ncbi:hypothetical protein [uncultured Sphingomonas sp.]|uniref:hypothetical protein n=1 Tax=uncultured Sphingomonas sp. TaxID=158754 RepID=UPI003749F1DE